MKFVVEVRFSTSFGRNSDEPACDVEQMMHLMQQTAPGGRDQRASGLVRCSFGRESSVTAEVEPEAQRSVGGDADTLHSWRPATRTWPGGALRLPSVRAQVARRSSVVSADCRACRLDLGEGRRRGLA